MSMSFFICARHSQRANAVSRRRQGRIVPALARCKFTARDPRSRPIAAITAPSSWEVLFTSWKMDAVVRSGCIRHNPFRSWVARSCCAYERSHCACEACLS